MDTVAWAWIQRYDRTENGREAMTALSNHYDGPGQVTKRLSEARSDINSLHYKGIESSFPFETYITRLQDNFETLRLNGEEEHESNQVRILLDGIDSSNSQLNAAKVNIGMSQTLRNDFTGACNALAEQIGNDKVDVLHLHKEGVEGVEAVVGEVAEENIKMTS